MPYTPNQEKVISHGKGNLMVSASAGSGKTTVMIERILSLLENGTNDAELEKGTSVAELERRVNVTEVLAITFTRKAAAEMREKLREKICERLASGKAKNPDHLAKQIRLLPLASVETIHSFCNGLLKSYFYAVDLDPAFELVSGSEADQLKQQAMEEVFSAVYEQGNPEFYRAISYFSKKRKDDSFKKRLIELSDFADSEEDPTAWIEKSRAAHTEEGVFRTEEEFFRVFKRNVQEIVEKFCQLRQQAEKIGIPPKTISHLADWEQGLRVVIDEKNDLYEGMRVFLAFSFDGQRKKINLSKEKRPEEIEWKAEVDEVKARTDSLQERYSLFGTKEEQRQNADLAAQSLNVIVQLLFNYRSAYARIKKENGRVDFSDLEHFTLRLLQNEEVRRSVSERYRYVFVDEYQDVNAVQERIISQITRDNLFIVGDVKQSIYGFRGCNPDLFLGKMQKAKEGELIELNDNFRCSEAVVRAANAVFCRAMTQETCDISYEEREKLVYGNTVPAEIEGESCAQVEAVYYPKTPRKEKAPAKIYSIQKEVENAHFGDERAEALCIAQTIASLVGKEYIPNPDKKKKEEEKPLKRTVQYGDIAILSRGKKDVRVLSLIEALKRYSIPCVCEAEEEILKTPEVSLLVALLSLSRNREEDVPFITVLLSPVGNLCEDDLLIVRKGAKRLLSKEEMKESSFVRVASVYAQEKEEGIPVIEQEIKKKLNAVFRLIQEISVKAAFLSAGELLSELITRYSLTPYFLGKRLGKQRVARVNRFLAECYDDKGKPLSVREMLRRVESGAEEITFSESSAGDTVRIMTMHASKGLEFPVVILMGMDKKFNTEDASNAIIASREHGIVPLSFCEENRTKKDGVLRYLAKESFARRAVKEEMRLFYVAMTRAQNRLYVVVPETIREKFSFQGAKNANNLCDFFAKELIPARKQMEEEGKEKDLRDLHLGKSEGAKEAIKEAIEFSYKHEKATHTPLKRTVTQMVQAAQTTTKEAKKGERDAQKESRFANPVSEEVAEEHDLQTALLSGEAYTEKQRKGIRMHAFLETCDFSACNIEEIQSAIRARIAHGLMKEEDLSLAPVLSRILSSPLFASFQGKRILREKEFTMRLYEEGMEKSEGSVLQGVIDLLVIGEGEGYLIDYKYSSRKAEQIWQTYAPQLDLYARAAEAFYGIKITKKGIINLTNGEMIEGRGEDLC